MQRRVVAAVAGLGALAGTSACGDDRSGNTTGDTQLPAHVGVDAGDIDVQGTCVDLTYPQDFQPPLVRGDQPMKDLMIRVRACVQTLYANQPTKNLGDVYSNQNTRQGYASVEVLEVTPPVPVTTSVESLTLKAGGKKPTEVRHEKDMKESWPLDNAGEAALTEPAKCIDPMAKDRYGKVEATFALQINDPDASGSKSLSKPLNTEWRQICLVGF
jgi:hypothetical protein